MTSSVTGRLKQSLHPIAHDIVFPVKSSDIVLKEFILLATLNEVQVLSLYYSKLMPLDIAKKILKAIAALRHTDFSALLAQPLERGAYLLFEHYLIAELGMDIAGSIHLGRSRNDMNATSFKINLRSHYQDIYEHLIQLRTTLLKLAKSYSSVAMPIYSQFQVAQVGTYGYYLLAIEEALARDQHALQDLFFYLDECPMGAAAGSGSSFPLDRSLSASLLGFSRSCNNALDAVGNRDLLLRMLSTLSVMGTTLSRVAQDYQIWTTQEFNFFDLPDEICGSSSMMPQKKNPYLLEVIKGRVTTLNGSLVQSLTAMHNVPFCNSVEVGTEAVKETDTSFKSLLEVLKLLNLFVGKCVPIPAQFSKSIHKGLAFSTNIAEILVREKNVPFREAHHQVGQVISDAMDKQHDPIEMVFKLLDAKKANSIPDIEWAYLNEYGGGPGKKSVEAAYLHANKRLKQDAGWISLKKGRWQCAHHNLQSHIEQLINAGF